MISLVDFDDESSHNESGKVNKDLVKREVEKIADCFQGFFEQKIQETLRKGLNSAINIGLTSVAKAGKAAVSSIVKKAFNGRSSSEVVKDLYAKRKKKTASTISDHEETPHWKKSASKKENQHKKSTELKKRDLYQESITEPKKTTLNESERDAVKAALKQAEKSKLPKDHDCQQGFFTSGYPQDEGKKLRGVLLRERSGSQPHILVPEGSDQEKIHPRKRTFSNCPSNKKSPVWKLTHRPNTKQSIRKESDQVRKFLTYRPKIKQSIRKEVKQEFLCDPQNVENSGINKEMLKRCNYKQLCQVVCHIIPYKDIEEKLNEAIETRDVTIIFWLLEKFSISSYSLEVIRKKLESGEHPTIWEYRGALSDLNNAKSMGDASTNSSIGQSCDDPKTPKSIALLDKAKKYLTGLSPTKETEHQLSPDLMQ